VILVDTSVWENHLRAIDEVLHFVDRNDLAGTGLGYVDVHLLASARLLAGPAILTRDKRLHEATIRLNLAV